MNEVIERPAAALAQSLPAQVAQQGTMTEAPRQLSVVEYAVQSGAPVAEVRALVEMQIQMDKHRMDMERYQDERAKELRAEEARKSYFKAMAEFKTEDVKILKNVEVTDGPLKGRSYADLFAWTSAVTQKLAKHGLSFAYKTDESPEFIAVTCIMRHQDGHEERETQVAKSDAGGAKNAIQAAGSAKKYLRRYTLQAALGMAEQVDTEDDDGQASGASVDPAADRLELWAARAHGATTLPALRAVFSEAAKAFGAARDKAGYAAFGAAAQVRAAVLKEAEHVA